MSGHRPTILQIIPRLDTGGAEQTTLEVTEAVVRAGGRMLVATEGGGTYSEEEYRDWLQQAGFQTVTRAAEDLITGSVVSLR